MRIPAQTTFFNRTYEEALSLLTEARNYVATEDLRPPRHAEPALRMAHCCEAMRVTARLTHVMAWLLAQRAVHCGEITLAEAAEEPFALGGKPTCMEEAQYLDQLGDPWLITLLDRSLKLYIRVSRLDQMVRDEVARTISIDFDLA